MFNVQCGRVSVGWLRSREGHGWRAAGSLPDSCTLGGRGGSRWEFPRLPRGLQNWRTAWWTGEGLRPGQGSWRGKGPLTRAWLRVPGRHHKDQAGQTWLEWVPTEDAQVLVGSTLPAKMRKGRDPPPKAKPNEMSALAASKDWKRWHCRTPLSKNLFTLR